jgi:hypothetical protein
LRLLIILNSADDLALLAVTGNKVIAVSGSEDFSEFKQSRPFLFLSGGDPEGQIAEGCRTQPLAQV